MKILILVSILTATMSVNRCDGQDAADKIDEIIGIRWFHAFEEDTAEAKTYRPASYSFPPARGRAGFRLEKDGRYIKYTIAPTDGNDSIRGHWEWTNGNRVHIFLNQSRKKGNNAENKEEYILEFIQLSEDLVQLKKHPVNE